MLAASRSISVGGGGVTRGSLPGRAPVRPRTSAVRPRPHRTCRPRAPTHSDDALAVQSRPPRDRACRERGRAAPMTRSRVGAHPARRACRERTRPTPMTRSARRARPRRACSQRTRPAPTTRSRSGARPQPPSVSWARPRPLTEHARRAEPTPRRRGCRECPRPAPTTRSGPGGPNPGRDVRAPRAHRPHARRAGSVPSPADRGRADPTTTGTAAGDDAWRHRLRP